MKLMSRLAFSLLLMLVLGAPALGTQEGVKPIESTMAYDLLLLERRVRPHPDTETLFRAAITDATNMAVKTNPRPRNRDDALAVLESIQVALVKHNFLQPEAQKDWPQTLGIALTPVSLTPKALEDALRYRHNVPRVKHLDPTKPYYYVDCDMGAQLITAVGERLGWDIRLVEVPDHNFVRWHLSDSIKVNWDWTRWASIEDSQYRAGIPPYEDVRLHSLYLRSFEPKETKAYYLGLIGSKASRPTDAERLFQEAVTVLPHHPLTLNNFAWLYATKPEFAKQKSAVAVAYALGAWSMEPNNGNIADTVACALAANGNVKLAERIEEFAIDHANAGQLEGFQENLKRILAGNLCK